MSKEWKNIILIILSKRVASSWKINIIAFKCDKFQVKGSGSIEQVSLHTVYF